MRVAKLAFSLLDIEPEGLELGLGLGLGIGLGIGLGLVVLLSRLRHEAGGITRWG